MTIILGIRYSWKILIDKKVLIDIFVFTFDIRCVSIKSVHNIFEICIQITIVIRHLFLYTLEYLDTTKNPATNSTIFGI